MLEMSYICDMSNMSNISYKLGVDLRYAFCVAFLFLMLMSCGQRPRSSVESVPIVRFDREVVSYAELDSAGRAVFRDSFGRVSDIMAAIVTRGAVPKADDSFLQEYSGDSKMRYYVPGIEERLGKLDSVEEILGLAKSNAAHMIPGLRWPDIYGAVLTYNQSVVSADSVLIVGLNHYLGPDYAPYSYFDNYQRYTKQKRLIPYHVVEAVLAAAYPYRPSSDATALTRMVYEGALSEAVLMLLESSDEAAVMGYNDEQQAWAAGNEANAWKTMIERGLLYSSDPVVSDRLLRPSPRTSVLHPDSPGRLGRFIGHRIVRSFIKHHPEVPLSELLDSAFYNSPKVLVNSGYYPG